MCLFRRDSEVLRKNVDLQHFDLLFEVFYPAVHVMPCDHDNPDQQQVNK